MFRIWLPVAVPLIAMPSPVRAILKSCAERVLHRTPEKTYTKVSTHARELLTNQKPGLGTHRLSLERLSGSGVLLTEHEPQAILQRRRVLQGVLSRVFCSVCVATLNGLFLCGSTWCSVFSSVAL